jgi:hypothetical protein
LVAGSTSFAQIYRQDCIIRSIGSAKEQKLWKSKWIDSDDAPELTRRLFRAADLCQDDKPLRRSRPPVGERLEETARPLLRDAG